MDLEESSTQQLELLCQAFYGGGDKVAQNEAHRVLLPLASNPANIPRLQALLARSTNLQALLFAAAGLTNAFTKHWTSIPEQLKVETRQFVLNYLYQHGPHLLHTAPQVLGHFIRLLCRIVKISWLENVGNQKVVEQVSQFLTASTSHWVVGLAIYAELTQEMQPQLGRQMARHRRTAFSFRDAALLDIFKVALQTLQQFHAGAIRVPDQQEEMRLLKQLLQLTFNCLSFDFLGTIPDDTTEEQTTVMLPQSWGILREENFPKTLFDLYELCWAGVPPGAAAGGHVISVPVAAGTTTNATTVHMAGGNGGVGGTSSSGGPSSSSGGVRCPTSGGGGAQGAPTTAASAQTGGGGGGGTATGGTSNGSTAGGGTGGGGGTSSTPGGGDMLLSSGGGSGGGGGMNSSLMTGTFGNSSGNSSVIGGSGAPSSSVGGVVVVGDSSTGSSNAVTRGGPGAGAGAGAGGGGATGSGNPTGGMMLIADGVGGGGGGGGANSVTAATAGGGRGGGGLLMTGGNSGTTGDVMGGVGLGPAGLSNAATTAGGGGGGGGTDGTSADGTSLQQQQQQSAIQLRVECGQLCLASLVLIGALRRSFFQKEEERAECIGQLIMGTSRIIDNRIGLHNDLCYHEFCRLLGKINTANQLSELCTSASFEAWTARLFTFTVESLADWKRLPNSKHYLLGVWAHMVSPLLFFKNAVPRQLDVYIHRITLAFVVSRLNLAEALANDHAEELDIENPLEHEVLLAEQLEVLTQLGRCRYGETAAKVLEFFHETRRAAEEKRISRAAFQAKITWLVYIVGALIGGHWTGRVPMTCGDEERQGPTHVVNAELAKLAFKLIEETNAFPDTPQCLELAYLYFLEQFRKVYIGEHARQIVDVQAADRFATVLGAADDDEVLGLLVGKIGFNLQQRAGMENVIKKTLSLFYELASGMNIVHCTDRSPHLIISGRLLLNNATAKYLLQNHRSEEFKFLNYPGYGKYRTTYYFTLAKLLFLGMGGNINSQQCIDKFETFMLPMRAVFEQLQQQAAGGANIQALRSPECKQPLVGLIRDLRGICMACSTSEAYCVFFSWLVNKPKQPTQSRIQIFTWAADVWWADSEVAVPLLKFMAEFVHNRGQRITFDQSSANGILLFKEVSSILITYGKRILEKQDFRDPYKEKYKGLAVALEMFSRALNGNYVNFGVFDLYGDGALDNALKLALGMCLAIPDEDLQAYVRSLKPFYSFLDLATKNFMPQLLELSPPMLAQLIRAVEDGLCAFEPGVSMQCCSTIDNIVTFFYQNLNSASVEGQAVRVFLETQPRSLQRVLQLMFQLVITGEFSSMWSMSRPLLGLILLHEQEFLSIKQQLLEQQGKDRRAKLETFFNELMMNVDSSLDNKNKDQFTRNLYQFSQSMRNSFV